VREVNTGKTDKEGGKRRRASEKMSSGIETNASSMPASFIGFFPFFSLLFLLFFGSARGGEKGQLVSL
jgi:hypothetical protein